MAITVSPKNYSQISSCDTLSSGGTWGGVDTVDSVDKKEGAASLCGTLRSSGDNDTTFTPTVAVDLSGTKHVRFWFLITSGSLVNTYALGGIQFWASDGVNTGYWYVGGRDTYPGGWHNFVVDVSKAVDAGTKPASMNAITSMGTRHNLIGIGKNVDNTWIDNLCVCDGLITYGDDAGGYYDFDDIYTIENDPSTGGWGILTRKAGAFCLTGSVEFGDASGVSGTKFQAKSQVVIFENRPNKDDTLSNINSNLMNFTIVDNGTGTTEFILGSKAGTAGIEGCTVRVADTAQIAKFKIDGGTDADVDNFKLYGSTFLDASTLKFPNAAANVEVLNCNFESCDEVMATTCVILNCNFVSANDEAFVLPAGDTHNLTYCNFINNPDAWRIPTAGSYTCNSCKFINNTNDIDNTSGGAVIINKENFADPVTSTGDTTIQGSVDLDVHVEDESGGNIQNAQVYIQKASPTVYTADAGNGAGNGALIVNEVVDTDTPQTGWMIVWDKDANELMPYRYASWAVKTFTFRTEETGACTSLGSGTQLLDTGADFGGTTDVKEGDTIRNTTDGSWAVVDEIISSTELLTTPLQGGAGDKTWESGDGWSVHKLAVALVDGDDIVDIPIMNMQTDASGDVTKVYTGGVANIKVRIRSNQGATKYLPYNTSGAIDGGGYALTAVMLEDEVAS